MGPGAPLAQMRTRRAETARRVCGVAQRDLRDPALGSDRADTTMQRRDQPAHMPGTTASYLPPVGAPHSPDAPRAAIEPAGRLAFQGQVRTEYTGGRWLAAADHVAPASPDPNTSPDVAPKYSSSPSPSPARSNAWRSTVR
jgi:hypothetical protein